MLYELLFTHRNGSPLPRLYKIYINFRDFGTDENITAYIIWAGFPKKYFKIIT
jgi:hypothetical protein